MYRRGNISVPDSRQWLAAITRVEERGVLVAPVRSWKPVSSSSRWECEIHFAWVVGSATVACRLHRRRREERKSRRLSMSDWSRESASAGVWKMEGESRGSLIYGRPAVAFLPIVAILGKFPFSEIYIFGNFSIFRNFIFWKQQFWSDNLYNFHRITYLTILFVCNFDRIIYLTWR